MPNPTVAVVTITSNRKELKRTIQSINEQTYPCSHYLFTDGIVSFEDYLELAKNYRSDKRFVSYWDRRTGDNGNHLAGAAPSLVTEDILMFLADDDWYKPNHVESLVNIIKEGNDWAYSFRSVYDKDGNYLFDDLCESLGEEHWTWNMEGHHFAETASVAMRTECYRNLANIYNFKEWGLDRIFYQNAKQLYPKFKGSKQHTVCFRLGGNPGSVTKDFLEYGNKFLMDKYNGQLPWVTNEI